MHIVYVLWNITGIIKTVQKILSKQKPSVQWYRTHCILVYVEISLARTVSRPVITIRASYSTGRSADRQLWVSVTGWSWKGLQLQTHLIVSRREQTKMILRCRLGDWIKKFKLHKSRRNKIQRGKKRYKNLNYFICSSTIIFFYFSIEGGWDGRCILHAL
jgi:hypothetical protein